MDTNAAMKALVLKEYKAPFILANIPRPTPLRGQALVKIKASGVNPLDIKIRRGDADHAKTNITATPFCRCTAQSNHFQGFPPRNCGLGDTTKVVYRCPTNCGSKKPFVIVMFAFLPSCIVTRETRQNLPGP
jgi:hypothetical protein